MITAQPQSLEPKPRTEAARLDKFVPFSPPSIGEEEIEEVADTLRSGWLTTGPKTERFENAVKEYLGARHAVAVNSCTAALHLALRALGVGEGDGVITSPYTFASTGHVVMYQRARLFLIDVEPDTFNLDPEKVQRFLEDECMPGAEGRPRHRATGASIKVLLPVHYGGHPCPMDRFLDLARRYNLYLVEDAAHALGAEYRGRRIGSFGDVTCFSFYATKNLTTGEGGLAATDDQELAQRMRVLGMYGISDARRIWQRYTPKGNWVYDVVDLGFKYNMMDIQAALGLHQLAKLPLFLERRAENAAIYNRVFGQLEAVVRPTVKEYARHAWHLYPLLLDLDRPALRRDAFIEELKARNVGTSVLFIPLHLHSYYQRALPYREGDFPVAENIFRRMVNLPLSPSIPAETITRVAEIVAELVTERS
ncbi:MAG: DegT/DnrJ/EryC1/StrS aminotransferase family protein [Thermodesulfobacteriota bacterium]